MGQEQALTSPAVGVIELTDVPPFLEDSIAVDADLIAGLLLGIEGALLLLFL